MLTLKVLPQRFAVCKVASLEGVDYTRPFVFVSKTDDELSLVCDVESVPQDVTDKETGWQAVKIAGQLDFGLVGIIAKISGILAAQGISLFVVSTYNTDYVLLKEANFERALGLLAAEGYVIER